VKRSILDPPGSSRQSPLGRAYSSYPVSAPFSRSNRSSGSCCARDRNFTTRRASYADRLLEEKEFFIRKALGWVLREVSKKDPEAGAEIPGGTGGAGVRSDAAGGGEVLVRGWSMPVIGYAPRAHSSLKSRPRGHGDCGGASIRTSRLDTVARRNYSNCW
jgi:hypothetical protein